MILRLGNKPGTIVTYYEPGKERPYMIKVYGGRLVAEGLTKEDAEEIVRAVNMKGGKAIELLQIQQR